MICPKCGHVAKDTDRFCVKCATKLTPVIGVDPAVEVAAAEAGEEIDRLNAEIQDAAEDIREEAVEEIAEAKQAAEELAEEPVHTFADAPVYQEPAVEPRQEIPPMPAAPIVPTAQKPVIEPAKEAAPAPTVSRLDKPLSTWGYLWRIFVAALPIIGIIPLFVFAFASGINKNSRGLARAILIIMLVLFALLLCGVILVLVLYDKEQVADYFKNILTAIGIA